MADKVLEYWFAGDQSFNYRTKWFPTGNLELQQQADKTIYEEFGGLFNRAINNELEDWKSDAKMTIALIVVLDQFSRHIYRFSNIPAGAPERIMADKLALAISEHLLTIPHWDSGLSTAEMVFALMPLRHSATVERLDTVMKLIEQREQVLEEGQDLLGKFRKQTTRRLQHLQDREKAKAADSILERHSFVADESDILENELVIATENFLTKHMKHPTNSLVISLSGGVDSMVISKILATLRDKRQMTFHSIVAIHIDYANREESEAEANYVEEWCSQLNILFRKRVINEVTRGITDRNEYEKVSRDIRYASYHEVLRETHGFTGEETHAAYAILFGHHVGDVQENVISNIMRGNNPLLLSGMNEVGNNHGVAIWRPLLAYTKDKIYEFAHRYGVPYFRDTTPSWSTRGKLRNSLVPLLVDMYGEGCLRNLTALAQMSDEMNALVHQNIYEPFLRAVERHPGGLRVNLLPFARQPLCFWKEMLKQLMHSMGMSMVKDRSVHNFMERLQRLVLHCEHQQGDLAPERATEPSPLPKTKLIRSQTLKNDGSITKVVVKKKVQSAPVRYKAHLKVDGWLEMRKGFHTYLGADGDLVVYKEGLLVETINKGGGKSAESHDDQVVARFLKCLSSANSSCRCDDSLSYLQASVPGGELQSITTVSDFLTHWLQKCPIVLSPGWDAVIGGRAVLHLPVWTIEVEAFPAQENSKEIPLTLSGNGVNDLLSGNWSYGFRNVPSLWCEQLWLLNTLPSNKAKYLQKHQSRFLKLFHSLEDRIVNGVPFFIPSPPDTTCSESIVMDTNAISLNSMDFKITYTLNNL